MADLVSVFLCPQDVSDFQHEIGAHGWTGLCVSVSSGCGWFQAWNWCQWLTWSLCFCVLRMWVISSMKLVSMADLASLFLCLQDVSDFQHEIGVNGWPGLCVCVSSGCEWFHAWNWCMADWVSVFLCLQSVSDFRHEIGVNYWYIPLYMCYWSIVLMPMIQFEDVSRWLMFLSLTSEWLWSHNLY